MNNSFILNNKYFCRFVNKINNYNRWAVYRLEESGFIKYIVFDCEEGADLGTFKKEMFKAREELTKNQLKNHHWFDVEKILWDDAEEHWN